jgi:hypothetical protein
MLALYFSCCDLKNGNFPNFQDYFTKKEAHPCGKLTITPKFPETTGCHCQNRDTKPAPQRTSTTRKSSIKTNE